MEANRYSLILLLSFCFVLVSTSVRAESIERVVYVTTDEFPIDASPTYSKRVEVFNLDLPSTFENQLISNMPKDKSLREQYVKKMFNQLGGARFRSVFGASAYAARFDLRRAPVFVINDKYVLYGLTNVEEAISIATRYFQKSS